MDKHFVDAHKRWPSITRVQSIKIRASFPQPESFGILRVKDVEFKLGLGPCGRHVTHLSHSIKDDLLTIVQESRLPDDLEGPDYGAYSKARRALEDDARLHRLNPPVLFYVPKFEQVIKEYRWGFWPIYESVEIKPPEVVVEGALTKEQEAAHRKTMDDYATELSAWRGRNEVKTFIYKIADIHGRIEVVTS